MFVGRSGAFAEMLVEEGSLSDAATGFDRALQLSASHPRAQIGKARVLAALARDGRADGAQARSLLDSLVRAPDSERTGYSLTSRAAGLSWDMDERCPDSLEGLVFETGLR